MSKRSGWKAYLLLGFMITSVVILLFTLTAKSEESNGILRRTRVKKIPTIPYHYGSCPCVRNLPQKSEVDSVCSDHATARGQGQKVIGTFFNLEVESKRASELLPITIPRTIDSIARQYPGWVIRLYTNQDPTRKGSGLFCNLFCNYDNVDICDVRNLPLPYGDVTKMIDPQHAEVWPMLMFLDDTISVYLDRKLSSAIYQREVVSVNDWLRSRWYAHSLKDHPGHYKDLISHTVGFHLEKNRNLSREIGLKILKVFKTSPVDYTTLLNGHIYGMVKSHILEHASYYCNKSIVGESRPFGSERPDRRVYIGYQIDLWGSGGHTDPSPISEKCSPECRPKSNNDWVYC